MSQEAQPVETLGVTRDGRPGLIVPLGLPYHRSVQLVRDHTHTHTHTDTDTDTHTHTHTLTGLYSVSVVLPHRPFYVPTVRCPPSQTMLCPHCPLSSLTDHVMPSLSVVLPHRPCYVPTVRCPFSRRSSL